MLARKVDDETTGSIFRNKRIVRLKDSAPQKHSWTDQIEVRDSTLKSHKERVKKGIVMAPVDEVDHGVLESMASSPSNRP